MQKNLKVTICSALKAKARAKALGQDNFITDDEIFGITLETFETISKIPFTIVQSRELTYCIIDEIQGIRHHWYIPKIFFDIEE